MSQLNVDTIKKADGTGNLSVPAETGTVVTTASPSLGRRNLIINGAMQVAQRGTSASGIGTGGYRTLDRWLAEQSGYTTHRVTYEQSTDAPDGYSNSYKVTTTASDSGMDYFRVRQAIEAQNLQHLKYGTSSAQTLTLSFWVKSSVTGTFGIEIYCNDGPRHRTTTYTVDAADTWEYKTITYTGDTSGVINNDTGGGMNINYYLYADSSRTATDSTDWKSYTSGGEAYGHVQNGVVTTTNATWQITGVQLEVGSVATPFEHRSFGEELAMCERYFQKSYNYASPIGSTNDSGCVMNRLNDAVTNRNDLSARFSTRMRAAPTITGYSLNGTANNVSDCGTGYGHDADVAINAVRKIGESGWAAISIGTSTNDTVGLHYTAEAEL
jgi:hypothetical protein